MTQPLTIRFKLIGGENGCVPKGKEETLSIEIVDGGASYHFNNSYTTRKFCVMENFNGQKCVYVQRLGKTFCKYTGLTSIEIGENIKKKLSEIAKIKKEM